MSVSCSRTGKPPGIEAGMDHAACQNHVEDLEALSPELLDYASTKGAPIADRLIGEISVTI